MESNNKQSHFKYKLRVDLAYDKLFIDCGEDQICILGDNNSFNNSNATFIVTACNEYDKLICQKENVIETLWNHYKTNGGYTRMAAQFIEKITGEKWERDIEYDKLKEDNKNLKVDFDFANEIKNEYQKRTQQLEEDNKMLLEALKEVTEELNQINRAKGNLVWTPIEIKANAVINNYEKV